MLAADCHVSEDVETQRAVERIFESNEAFRGVASQQQELVADAYGSLKSARHELCEALREGLPPDQPGVLVYNPFDNDICFKKKPLVDSDGAHDRRGKVKKERFTTKRLEAALHWRLTWPAPRGLKLPRSKPYNSSVQSSGARCRPCAAPWPPPSCC